MFTRSQGQAISRSVALAQEISRNEDLLRGAYQSRNPGTWIQCYTGSDPVAMKAALEERGFRVGEQTDYATKVFL